MRCMAVSKAFHLHLTSKLASADELLSTALAVLLYRKAKNIENLYNNDDGNGNFLTVFDGEEII